jgi:hypothetical protein
VDMEERHHTERHVIRRKLVVRNNILHRSRNISMEDRHAFGPPGASARVKNKGDVIGRWRRGSFAAGRARNPNESGGIYFE